MLKINSTDFLFRHMASDSHQKEAKKVKERKECVNGKFQQIPIFNLKEACHGIRVHAR